MKNILAPFLLTLFVLVSGFVQVKPPVKKVYAYKQASIPGIVPVHTEENKTKQKKTERKQEYNYWFYMELPKSEKITITGLWISGIRYSLKEDAINDLPVKKIIFTGIEKNDTTVMVPFTRNKIILVYPAGKMKEEKKGSAPVTDIARTNELVISYTSKGKIYYASVKKIKELAPDVMP